MMIDGLEGLGLMLEGVSEKLERLEEVLVSLKCIAEKELEERPLSILEIRRLRTMGETMAALIYESVEGDPPGYVPPNFDPPRDMAVIADVHTDPNTNQVLEEGVGRPLNLYVVVADGQELFITMGSAYTYYEFTWPMGDRLTDEAWRELLKGPAPPSLPEWTGSYLDLTRRFASAEQWNVQNRDNGPVGELAPEIQPASPMVGNPVKIRLVFSHAFQHPLLLEAIGGDKVKLLEMALDPGTPAPYDYIATLDTQGWAAGRVAVTAYTEESLQGTAAGSFWLGQAAVGERAWALYE
jgi:hypothetical protein